MPNTAWWTAVATWDDTRTRTPDTIADGAFDSAEVRCSHSIRSASPAVTSRAAGANGIG